jgi:hypothetical protein
MPNGHGQRQEDEEQLIEAVEEDGWAHFPDPPDWVVDAAKSDGIPSATIGFEAAQKKYHGDNYIYLAVSSVHGNHLHVFSQKKSEYFETTPKKEPVRTAKSASRDTRRVTILPATAVVGSTTSDLCRQQTANRRDCGLIMRDPLGEHRSDTTAPRAETRIGALAGSRRVLLLTHNSKRVASDRDFRVKFL